MRIDFLFSDSLSDPLDFGFELASRRLSSVKTRLLRERVTHKDQKIGQKKVATISMRMLFTLRDCPLQK